MRKSIYLLLFTILLFASCKKEESNGVSITSLSGTYYYDGRSNISIKKWISGGNEVNPADTDITNLVEEGRVEFNGITYNFGPNNMLSYVDSINNEMDSAKYKIENNIVYVFIGPNPIVNSNYIPFFRIVNNGLYIGYKTVLYSTDFGESGLGMTDIDNSNLIDTALSNMGYNSVNQLKDDEFIKYTTYKDNFKKKP